MLLGFYLVGRSSHALATLWLAIASLFFYGWWDVRYVALLLASIVFNYFAGALIARARRMHDLPNRGLEHGRSVLDTMPLSPIRSPQDCRQWMSNETSRKPR